MCIEYGNFQMQEDQAIRHENQEEETGGSIFIHFSSDGFI